ncbi:MAG: isoprenylcysteine carboxylmethyltransferase family protein [Lachnospiraceae bacterium]|nr:isoprenylcysteine carboxylmethyltransferase family protein [Lachnospiraceae bacterium]
MNEKEKEHLPVIGVGPVYVAIIILCTVVGIVLSQMKMLESGKIEGLKFPFLIIGIILILFGVYLWFCANYQAKVFDGIVSNTLVTTGVYAYVRNPIYSAFMLVCTGALLIANNCWLLVLPFFYWGFMTIFMKLTEEKWLYNLYGEEYAAYCKKVNRCIPWFKKI